MAKINAILFCDSYELSSDQSHLSLTGVFDTIFSDNIPAVHQRMIIFVNFDKDENDRTESFRIRRMDTDEIILESDENTISGNQPKHQFLHEVSDLPLSASGDYLVEILINGVSIGTNFFRVTQN